MVMAKRRPAAKTRKARGELKSVWIICFVPLYVMISPMRRRKFGCAMCDKGVQYAHNVSHAKNRTKTIKRPNLHTHKMVVDGVKIKVKLCTKCKRVARKVK